jgi:hypothetical protein
MPKLTATAIALATFQPKLERLLTALQAAPLIDIDSGTTASGRIEVFAFDLELGLEDGAVLRQFGRTEGELRALIDRLLGVISTLTPIEAALQSLLEKALAIRQSGLESTGIKRQGRVALQQELQMLNQTVCLIEPHILGLAGILEPLLLTDDQSELAYLVAKVLNQPSPAKFPTGETGDEIARLVAFAEIHLTVMLTHGEVLSTLDSDDDPRDDEAAGQLIGLSQSLFIQLEDSAGMLCSLLYMLEEEQRISEVLSKNDMPVISSARKAMKLLLPTFNIGPELYVLRAVLTWLALRIRLNEELTNSKQWKEILAMARSANRRIAQVGRSKRWHRLTKEDRRTLEEVEAPTERQRKAKQKCLGLWLRALNVASHSFDSLEQLGSNVVDRIDTGRLIDLLKVELVPIGDLIAVNTAVIDAAKGLSDLAATLSCFLESLGHHHLAQALAEVL